MEIKLHEIKKIVTSPIVLALTIVFISFNIFVIFNNSYIRNDLKLINNIIYEFGYEINDEVIKTMKEKNIRNLNKLNDITMEKFKNSYKSIEDFFESEEYQNNIYKYSVFTENEKEFFNEINLLDMYSTLAIDLVDSYENIDIRQIAEQDIKAYGLTGKTSEITMKKYIDLENRFEEIKENAEHKNFFFFGKQYQTHSMFFGDLFSYCIYQIMILVVLITSYLINYEFDNKTNLVVYSTKRGRENDKDKLIICIVSTFIISTLILGITLLSYFITFDYSRVMNVPINSVFNWENPKPYISWFNHTILQRIVVSIIVVLVVSIIFTGITFIISKLIKSSYIVFFVFFIVFGINIIIPSLVGTNSGLIMYLQYDVFSLILNPHMWFMSKDPLIINKYYEVITLSSWIIIVVLGSLSVMKRFKKQDIS
ncbi:MAG: hypothetical protein ACRC3Y_09580 [Romboutsia sp.]|uniref:hypothetical protein n=1 Tax=Romboutsia sp. TaxID=1965302 RepID=UPI003F3605E4